MDSSRTPNIEDPDGTYEDQFLHDGEDVEGVVEAENSKGDNWLDGANRKQDKPKAGIDRVWTLDSLSLSYGLESNRLNRSPGKSLWLDDDARSRKSWEDLEADAKSRSVRPKPPSKAKGRLVQGQSPRVSRRRR